MCLAIPGKIIKVEDNLATIDYGTETRTTRIMNPKIRLGDYVVVQNKLILQSIPKDQALESIKLWKIALKNEN